MTGLYATSSFFGSFHSCHEIRDIVKRRDSVVVPHANLASKTHLGIDVNESNVHLFPRRRLVLPNVELVWIQRPRRGLATHDEAVFPTASGCRALLPGVGIEEHAKCFTVDNVGNDAFANERSVEVVHADSRGEM